MKKTGMANMKRLFKVMLAKKEEDRLGLSEIERLLTQYQQDQRHVIEKKQPAESQMDVLPLPTHQGYSKTSYDIDRQINKYDHQPLPTQQHTYQSYKGMPTGMSQQSEYESNTEIFHLLQKKAEKGGQEEGKEYVENYKNGGRYEGGMKDGRREGRGVLYFKDGGYYQGQWLANKMNGFGRLYYADNRLAYEGEWENDQFHG